MFSRLLNRSTATQSQTIDADVGFKRDALSRNLQKAGAPSPLVVASEDIPSDIRSAVTSFKLKRTYAKTPAALQRVIDNRAETPTSAVPSTSTGIQAAFTNVDRNSMRTNTGPEAHLVSIKVGHETYFPIARETELEGLNPQDMKTFIKDRLAALQEQGAAPTSCFDVVKLEGKFNQKAQKAGVTAILSVMSIASYGLLLPFALNALYDNRSSARQRQESRTSLETMRQQDRQPQTPAVQRTPASNLVVLNPGWESSLANGTINDQVALATLDLPSAD